MHCGKPIREKTSYDVVTLSRLTANAPAGLATKARAAAHLSGERRVVTVLMVDVVGSTALSEALGVESWTRVLNGMFDLVTPIIYRYEGTIAHLLGDSLVAFFGAPIAHEDDPIRAVRAGLDVIEYTKGYAKQVESDQGVTFAIRACLNTGPVVHGPVDEMLRYDFHAIGGAVNITNRIKFAVKPMTVAVTEATYRFIEPLFKFVDLGEVEVKGKFDPVHTYQVLGQVVESGQVRGLVGLESPMVGRDRELAQLKQLIETVQAGIGRAVLISGEPGMGKTRLMREWRADVLERIRQTDVRWVIGRSLSYAHQNPYQLVTELFRQILRVENIEASELTFERLSHAFEEIHGRNALRENIELRGDLPYIAHLLGLPQDAPEIAQLQNSDPQALQAHYLDSLRNLILHLSSSSLLMVVLEDLHWSDPSSIELLVKLLPDLVSAPLALCLMSRIERESTGWKLINAARDLLGDGLTELHLDALTDLDTRELVANLLDIDALSEEIRSLILHKSEGNPYFVEEVIRMLIDRGAIVRENGRWRALADVGNVEIPDNLQGLLLARIDRLPEEVKYTLKVASVIGRQFPVEVLEKVLEKGDIG
jgi:class 3 adenylate cyclase